MLWLPIILNVSKTLNYQSMYSPMSLYCGAIEQLRNKISTQTKYWNIIYQQDIKELDVINAVQKWKCREDLCIVLNVMMIIVFLIVLTQEKNNMNKTLTTLLLFWRVSKNSTNKTRTHAWIKAIGNKSSIIFRKLIIAGILEIHLMD